MKKLLLFLLSLMAIAPLHAQEQTADVHTSDAAIVKAPASSEKPLLVEDGKLWKVRAQNCTVTSSYGFIDYNQWFEGTKVIDGKTYNVLKAQITFPELSEVYEIAYMREDQGKVYSVSNPEIAGIAKWNLYCNSYLFNTEEAMVYDFNLTPGESYYWFDPAKNDQILDKIAAEFPLNESEMVFLRNPFEVTDLKTINQFKYPIREQYIKGESKTGNSFTTVFYDRVGSIQANLPFPCLKYSFDCPSTWDIEVFDPDGSMIFSTKELNGVESTSISVEGALGYEVTDSEIIVNGITGKATVVLLTPAGKIVKTVHIRDGETVDLSDMTHGVYILHIIDDASRISDKVAL